MGNTLQDLMLFLDSFIKRENHKFFKMSKDPTIEHSTLVEMNKEINAFENIQDILEQINLREGLIDELIPNLV